MCLAACFPLQGATLEVATSSFSCTVDIFIFFLTLVGEREREREPRRVANSSETSCPSYINGLSPVWPRVKREFGKKDTYEYVRTYASTTTNVHIRQVSSRVDVFIIILKGKTTEKANSLLLLLLATSVREKLSN